MSVVSTNYNFINNGGTYDLGNIFLSSLVTIEPVNRASISNPANSTWVQVSSSSGNIYIFNSSNKPGYYIVNISFRSTNLTIGGDSLRFDYCVGTSLPETSSTDPREFIGSSGYWGANGAYTGYYSYGSQLVGIVYYDGITNWNVYIRKNSSSSSTFTYTTNCIIGPIFPNISLSTPIYGSITNYNSNIGGTNYDLNKIFLSGSLTYQTTSDYQTNPYNNNWYTNEYTIDIPNNTPGYYMMYFSILPNNGSSDALYYYAVLSNTGTGPLGEGVTTPMVGSNCVSLFNLLGGNFYYNYTKSTSNLIYHNGDPWYIYTKIIGSSNSDFFYNISIIGPLTPYSS